jgi:hypothetical protein
MISNYTENSIAVWLDEIDKEKIEGVESPTLHLDINLWSTEKVEDSYIEIAFKVKSWINLRKINCVLPIAASRSIFDKAPYLVENQEVIEGLLNESVNLIRFDEDPRFTQVQFQDKTSESLMLYSPEKNLETERLTSEGGALATRVEISLPRKLRRFQEDHLINNSNLYVRLRFKASSYEPIIQTRKTLSSLFNGMSERISFVDFRVNSHRSLPRGLQAKAKNTKISSINFFLMTDAWNKIEMATDGLSKSRLLESHIWNGYLSDPYFGKKTNQNYAEKIVAYHWKFSSYKKNGNLGEKELDEERAVKGYNIFVKLYRAKSSWYSFALTVFWLIFAGVLGSLFATFVLGGSS